MHRPKLFGVGVDIIELERFKKIKFLARAAELILTPAEYKQFKSHNNPAIFLASRLAVKEAVIKACPETLTYHDFEIIKAGKKPLVRLLSKQAHNYQLKVSLSHSTDYVAGFAVAF
ncbi:MAG: holo-ACP synthase [Candidatus Portnoybacteria bacterium]|nr:holo-ACP synthase [Candidatus Portnoybacteria bacterium]